MSRAKAELMLITSVSRSREPNLRLAIKWHNWALYYLFHIFLRSAQFTKFIHESAKWRPLEWLLPEELFPVANFVQLLLGENERLLVKDGILWKQSHLEILQILWRNA